MSDDDLQYLKRKGIKALVRTAERHKTKVSSDQIEKDGFTDCDEPVPVFTAHTEVQIDKLISFIAQSADKKPGGVTCGGALAGRVPY